MDISCSPLPHFHYWHDPVFNRDHQIPESFLQEVRIQLELPLTELRAAVEQAMAEMDQASLAFKILQEALDASTAIRAELVEDAG